MKKVSTLAFTGDIGFDRYMDRKWEDENFLAEEILQFLHEADHVIPNVEGPFLAHENAEGDGVGFFHHSMDPAAISALNAMHADIWNICNNHMMDEGPKGVSETLRYAKMHGVKTIGAGMDLEEASRPILLEEAGGIGLISVGYRRGCKPAAEGRAGCFLWHEMDLIKERIEEIKKTCRWCVVICHGGEEFTSLPSPYTRNRFMQYLDFGADVIVNHHPHVPMNYETVGEKTIFYSLGNFIFDTDYQRAQFNTEIGILLQLHFTEESYSWDALGIQIDREEGRIIAGELPRIFVDVQEEEYELLKPLAAKMMVSAYKRQLRFMQPDVFTKETTEVEWKEEFLKEIRSGRVVGEGLDFHIIYPLAQEAENGEWKKSSLEDVKEYLLEQMD